MSWFQDQKELGFLHSLVFKIIKSGNIPKHVAIIMDGNRRFARKHCLEKKDGHSKGFEKLAQVLHWCFELGIPEVTVYAFSTENFKRSEEEVNGLMALAKEKFDRLMEEKDMIMKYGVCVRVLGDASLLPEDVRTSVARVVDFSKMNSKSTLNVAMAYSSRHEITEAVKEIAAGIKNGLLAKNDLNELLLEKCLYSRKSADVDLLIRTSGEVRLSDFLMWQSSYSMLAFVDELWPEFTIWQFLKCVLSYQLGYSVLQDTRKTLQQRQIHDITIQDMIQAQRNILETVERGEHMGENAGSTEQIWLNDELKKVTLDRECRVERFLANLEQKRNSLMQS
ncbi:dehydrodolichyl diphosphate synthase complex subunit DHDDS-like [Rhopilema esculentum]|uniref:dehydrodolichyl diphosphate synthase complex subunit DHDDS-like n=1 Tax=Rhopilema esculentum TaxID=499914 RepID=UPI0031D3706A